MLQTGFLLYVDNDITTLNQPEAGVEIDLEVNQSDATVKGDPLPADPGGGHRESS